MAQSNGLRPMPGLVLIEPDKSRQESATKSGILLAAPEFEGAPLTGVVFAIGRGVAEVKIGDHVAFKMKGKGFKWEGRPLLSVQESDVSAILG